MANKALIIEDNEQNMILEADLLKIAGFEVLQAYDAITGIELAKKEKPDVIVMDVRLPNVPGTTAAQLLLANKETSSIPIVFVTASVIGKDMDEVRKIHRCTYISKPIDVRTFAKVVSNCMVKQEMK
jgi:two-component system, cell cycle response regulator DivK